MEFYNDISSNYLKGKSVYPEVRRVIYFLLMLSLSSYVYKLFFGPYVIIQLSDYQNLVDFFLGGFFFIPFSVFIVTYFSIYIIQSVLFHFLSFYPIFKLKKKIIEYKVTLEDKKQGQKFVKKISKYSIKNNVSEDELIQAFTEYKEKLNNNVSAEIEITKDLEKDLEKPKRNIESNFNMSILMIIATIVFYFNIKSFPITLMVIILLISLTYFIIAILTYRMLDILPTILLKIPAALKDKSPLDNKL